MRFRIVLIIMLIEFYRTLNEFMIIMIETMNDLDDLLITTCRMLAVEVAAITAEKHSPLRIQNYVENVISGQTAKQFQEHFRMTRDSFDVLLNNMAPKLISCNKFSPVTKLLDPKKQLLAVLWLLATPDSYRSVAERFDMAKSSLHKSFVYIVNILNEKRCIIKWPHGNEERNARKFKRFSPISGAIGAVDGSYIPIKAPKEYPERYINRKCYHAITLQAICDADLLFIDVFTGYPSSVSDRRIFINSCIYKNISMGKLTVPNGYFILGDKAYPVLKWCIPPYIDRGTLSDKQKKFNVAVSQSRQCIERAFALLKGRFRRLKYLDMSMTHFIPSVIMACCILHNLCLMNGEDTATIQQYVTDGMPTIDGDEEPNAREAELTDVDGNSLRDRLMMELDL